LPDGSGITREYFMKMHIKLVQARVMNFSLFLPKVVK
jgi:hypothetical protein